MDGISRNISAPDSWRLTCGTLRRYLAAPGAIQLFVDVHRRLPRLAPPERTVDKILWRKLFDHNPLFVTFNDKLAAKDWVRVRLPGLAIPETLWVGTSARDLPDALLRQEVAIKANHGCNFNILFDDGLPPRAEIERKLAAWLAKPFGQNTAQWAYGSVPRRVFVEEMIRQADGSPPAMVNVHVMDGVAAYVGIYLGPKTGERYLSFFTPEGDRLPISMLGSTVDIPVDWRIPPSFARAVTAAEELGRGVDYVRCDFLCTEYDAWFSELTTYVADGRGRFDDPELADRLHSGWDIGKSWFIQTPQVGWREAYRLAMQHALRTVSNPHSE